MKTAILKRRCINEMGEDLSPKDISDSFFFVGQKCKYAPLRFRTNFRLKC